MYAENDDHGQEVHSFCFFLVDVAFCINIEQETMEDLLFHYPT